MLPSPLRNQTALIERHESPKATKKQGCCSLDAPLATANPCPKFDRSTLTLIVSQQ